MSKNAYQIRLEVLCLARDILAERCSTSNVLADEKEPDTYSVDDVLVAAEKLLVFVNDEASKS